MVRVDSYWVTATARGRVWADTHETHKMGWVQVGSRATQMRVVEEYRKWLRFDQFIDGPEIKPHVEGYREWWILADAVEKGTSPPPPPPPPPVDTSSDAELGAAFRTIATFLAELFR